MHHLLLKCSFVRFVWFLTLQNLKINGSWETTSVVSGILGVVKEKVLTRYLEKGRVLKLPSFDYSFCWGCFDEASQGSSNPSGARMILYFTHSYYFKLKLGTGKDPISEPNFWPFGGYYIFLI